MACFLTDESAPLYSREVTCFLAALTPCTTLSQPPYPSVWIDGLEAATRDDVRTYLLGTVARAKRVHEISPAFLPSLRRISGQSIQTVKLQ
jgi:hypothetical protein